MLSSRVRCIEMAAKFDFSFAENYGYVDSLDKVHRLIRDHELNTTAKYALLKAPKDFDRKVLYLNSVLRK